MTDETAPIPISIRLPTDVIEKLDQIAAALDRPRSWIILRAIRNYLADEGQEILDVQQGVAEADRGEVVPVEEVLAEMEELITRLEAKRAAG